MQFIVIFAYFKQKKDIKENSREFVIKNSMFAFLCLFFIKNRMLRKRTEAIKGNIQ